jgi:hypothetical protein
MVRRSFYVILRGGLSETRSVRLQISDLSAFLDFHCQFPVKCIFTTVELLKNAYVLGSSLSIVPIGLRVFAPRVEKGSYRLVNKARNPVGRGIHFLILLANPIILEVSWKYNRRVVMGVGPARSGPTAL